MGLWEVCVNHVIRNCTVITEGKIPWIIYTCNFVKTKALSEAVAAPNIPCNTVEMHIPRGMYTCALSKLCSSDIVDPLHCMYFSMYQNA